MNSKIKKILNKKNKSKIVCLTAYSKSIAKILDNYCDIILVGDSMANVLYGLKTTHKLTIENVIQHTLSVKKGIKKSASLIKKNGKFILEIGFDQKNRVINLLKKEGFYINSTQKDLANNDRCIVSTKI